MLQRKFIRLNINDNYLSLGNVFRIIKEEANNTNMFLQSDLFAIIFNTYNIADSTVILKKLKIYLSKIRLFLFQLLEKY